MAEEEEEEAFEVTHEMELGFSRESPYFASDLERHRLELRAADEHLGGVSQCANALITAMQGVGRASGNLAATLERTPATFQAAKVVSTLKAVLEELASAEGVLAESLELSLAKPLSDLRRELSKVEDLRRVSLAADLEAETAAESLLHGEWKSVEREIAASVKACASNRSSSPPPAGLENKPLTLASVVDERARLAAAKRRAAELRRFELARQVSSLQRRKGLALGEASVATLCSLRAFYKQAGHAIGEAAQEAQQAQTEIAETCERQREPWDYKMLKMQEILNARLHRLDQPLEDWRRQALYFYNHDEEEKSEDELGRLLGLAETEYGVFHLEAELGPLYSPSSFYHDQHRLQGYLWSQPIESNRRRPVGWTRRWFVLDAERLRAVKEAPSAVTAFVRSALMREPSETEEEWTDTVPTMVATSDVADLLLSSVRVVAPRCCFEVHSAKQPPIRLQAAGKADFERWVKALRSAIADQLSSSETPRNPHLPPQQRGAMLRTFSSSSLLSPHEEEDSERSKSPPPAPSSPPEERAARKEAYRMQVAEVEALNPVCVDCGASNPDWCVINLGIVVCLGCSGVHRSLGTHVSKVRSLQLDKLDCSLLDLLKAAGNAKLNAVYDSVDRPAAGDAALATFIGRKWRDKAFVTPAADQDAALLLAVAADDHAAALAAIARGASLLSRDADERTPLHLARSAAMAQVVLLNASDTRALALEKDAKGDTPLDSAIHARNSEMAELLGPLIAGR